MIAKGLTIHRQAISTATREGNELAHQLLGLEPSGCFEGDKLANLIEQSPGRAQHIALAIVLGACESVTSKQTWRYPSATDGAYFTQLTDWGYGLSDVEQIVTSVARTADSDKADDGADLATAEP